MSRFILGDELGNIKTLRFTENSPPEPKTTAKLLHARDKSLPAQSIQKLAINNAEDHLLLASASSDGECSLFFLSDDDELSKHCSWQENRFKGSRFVGSSIFKGAVLTCTANGMLRRTPYGLEENSITISDPAVATLPSRLFDWRQSADGDSFAYGGDEVDLSIWDTERAFHTPTGSNSTPAAAASKKRKRNDDLFPAETWRARNVSSTNSSRSSSKVKEVPNDHLGLRQPVRISALTYLDSSPSGHLAVGTQFGDVRIYDTKAGRRPVSNWKSLAKAGGVKAIEKGHSEHELFVADGGSSLYAVDLRNGGVVYGYKGIAGAVTSIAPSPTVIASTSLGRFARIHSTSAPPPKAGAHMEQRGEILDKAFVNATPTVVIWDQCIHASPAAEGGGDDDDEETWNQMENIS